jgi:hypothetical protein
MKLIEELLRIKKVMGLINEGDDDQWDAVLVGGLDNRSGDYKINDQVELLKKGLGQDKKVKGFRYNTPTSEIKSFLDKNPNVSVYLFSAGCNKAGEISKLNKINKNKVYIIEPYGKSKNVTSIVNFAVNNGIPSSNVYSGSGSARGEGITSNSSKTKNVSHWGSLEFVGQKTKNDIDGSSNSTTTNSENKKMLEIGSKGERVRKLQKLLKIYEDGIFGPQTKRCVEIFQEKNQLSPTGYVDKNTIIRIKEMIDKNTEYKSPKFCQIKRGSESPTKITSGKNIIIGDSISPWLAKNISKASLLSKEPGPKSLWQGGKNVSWLINSLQNFPTSENIKNVIITIGTNGGFNSSDNISGLFSSLKAKFPNAKFLVVQGSWGWGGNKNVTSDKVRKYYSKYKNEGAIIIEPPVGNIEPHGNRPVYQKIGTAIDSLL